MSRFTKSTLWLGLVLVSGFGIEARGQGLYPPAPGANLAQVSRQMAEALRGLTQNVEVSLGRTPGGEHLVRDCEELRRSTGEWHESTRGINDPYQLRRSYSGIDLAWHRLRGRLNQPGLNNPAILEEIRHAERADAEIHQALNLNAYPPNLDGAAPPTGQDEARRLAYSMAQRGEALAAMVQSIYGPDPGAAALVNDSGEVARMADGFSDGLGNGANLPPIEQARQSFEPLFVRSVALGRTLDRYQMPPNLRSNWLAYATALNLCRDHLGMTNLTPDSVPQPTGPAAFSYNPNPAPQVAQWADGLDRQVDELIANFGPTAQVVPEGRDMLGEMERLRDRVRHFREVAAQGNPPGRLAHEFREVDESWQRLARRVNRIARGRNGPNIQRVQQIGQTCEQIHQVLGMPGYSPVINPY